MKSPIRITPASRDDLITLARLERSARSHHDVVSRFMHNNNKWADPVYMCAFDEAFLRLRLRHPSTQIFKATCHVKWWRRSRIVGHVCLTRREKKESPEAKGKNQEEEEEDERKKQQTMVYDFISSLPDTVNKEFFAEAYAKGKKMNEHMNGEDYYQIAELAVDPKHQGQGIGTQLIRHCLEIVDQEGLPTWIIATPWSHSLWPRFGFVDVDHRDFDLNAYDGGRMRGFGIFRDWGMVRRLDKPAA